MKFPAGVRVYGDQTFRGDCPSETAELVTFFARMRKMWPATWGKLAIHARNEGRRSFAETARQKSEGMQPGAADIVIPGAPAFVCEMKRRDHTKSSWQKGQIEYLEAAVQTGAFVCVALGCDAAIDAFQDHLIKVLR